MYPDFVLQLCFRLPNGAHFASGFGSIIWFGGHFQIRERAELDPYDVVASPRVAMSSGDPCVCV
jgi:type IV secretory pathway TrbD component